MSNPSHQLAALLASRICHDIISPLGAIGNGIELLELSGLDTPEMALIREAVGDANRRLRAFRVAFGAAGAEQMLGAGDIAAALPAPGGKLAVDWQVPGDLPRREAKLALLALMCLETALPFGGRVTVTRTAGGWRLEGSGERLKLDPALWSRLAAPAGGELPPAGHLHFVLLPAEASAQGRTLATTLDKTRIEIAF